MLQLHHCLQNDRQRFKLIHALDTKRPVASLGKGDLLGNMPSPLYTASVVLFQLHGGMRALATPSSNVYNTKNLDHYH